MSQFSFINLYPPCKTSLSTRWCSRLPSNVASFNALKVCPTNSLATAFATKSCTAIYFAIPCARVSVHWGYHSTINVDRIRLNGTATAQQHETSSRHQTYHPHKQPPSIYPAGATYYVWIRGSWEQHWAHESETNNNIRITKTTTTTVTVGK